MAARFNGNTVDYSRLQRKAAQSISVVQSTWVLLIAWLAFARPMAHGFDFPLSSKGNLRYTVDVCQFAERGGKTRVEVYYSLPLSQLSGKDASVADLDIQIRIDRPELAEPTCFRERKRLEIPAFSSESGEYYYLDMKGFVVDSGEVALYMSMSDSARGRSGVVNQEFKVRYFGEELTLSDVLFVSQIRRAGEPSNLMRHGYLMIPAVARSFEVTGDSTWAWIYFEVNNLGKPSDRSTAYDVRLWVTDLTGRKSFEKTERGNNAKSRDIARVEKIPLHGMPSGVYRLDLEIEEAATHRTVRTGAYFSVWNPRLGESDLLPMEAGDEREYYDQIKYIATEDELRLFESLDRQAKQKFILWFFEVRDPDPRTPENEFLIEHLRRIAYCKAHFAGGVNSDMGRIYIKYGPPLEIQRWFSSTEYSKPVEIWTYAIRGRTEFVFVDRNGDGRYVLVHSSHPDEFANPEWEAELRR